MKKRIIAALLTFIFIFSTITIAYTPKVYAYQNSSYYNKIRIGLKSMAAPSVNITLNGAYVFNGQALSGGTSYTLTVQSGKVLFRGVQYDSVSLTPQLRDNTLVLDTGSKRYKYFGTMLFKVNSTNVFAINTLGIEDYLKGVVGLEMSDYFPLDALKAQAIAARNYTLANLGTYSAYGYDLTDTIDSQVYGGYNESYKNVLRAVEETRGQVQLYGDALVQAFYSASDGGYTEAVENVWYSALPYMKAKADSFDNESWTSPMVFTNAQIDSTLKTKGYLTATDSFIKLDLTTITRFPSGRAASVDIVYRDSTGLEKRKSVTKDKTRTFLTLPSSLYNIAYDPVLGKYTFTGKGNGHGIGLSQIGAKNRALAGQKYDNILGFYYDGSYIQSIIPRLDGVTINKTTAMLNQPVAISASAIHGSGTGYLFKFVVSRDNVPIYTRDYADSGSLSYTPSTAGSYSVTVYAKDKLSESDFDDKASVGFTAYELPQLTAVNISGTLYENREVKVNAQASGGSPAGQSYRFELYKDGILTDSRGFEAAASYSFIPSTYGSYTIKTFIKDSASTNAYDDVIDKAVTILREPRLDTLTIDRDKALAGQQVKLNAAGKGGSGTGYLYRYEILLGGSPVYSGSFGPDASLIYTPVNPGSYTVNVYLKDNITDRQYDDQQSLSFTAYSAPELSSPVISGTRYQSRPLTVSVQTNGGSTEGQSYSFELYRDGVLADTKAFSGEASYTFIPQSAGAYIVKAYVKDALTTKAYDNTLEIPVTISEEPKLDSFSISKTSTLAGQGIDFAAAAKGGSGTGYLYKYQIIKDGVIVYSTEFDTASALTYIPSGTGTYTASVYMKDKITDKTYDDVRSVDFSSYAVPQLSAINITGKLYEKRPVTVSAVISGGSTAGVYYRFELYKGGVLTATRDYSTDSSYTFTPPVYGSYSTKTFIKDGITTSLYDDTRDTALTIQREPVVVSTLPIYWGMKGPDVVQIQTGLTNLGYSLGTIDGIFGSKTYNAVVGFQKFKGLTANGTVDKATLDAMNDALINK